MDFLGNITSFDVIVGLIFFFFLIRGVWIGFMRQLAAFLALVGSYWVAGRYTSELEPYVSRVMDNPKLIFLVSFSLLFLLMAMLFILGGKVLRRVMEISLLGWFDRFLGLLLGGVKGMVVVSLMYMILASSLSGSNELLRKSLTSPYLARGANILYGLLNDPQVRALFLPKEPAIKAEPVPEHRDQYQDLNP